jgi:hypothetical protein
MNAEEKKQNQVVAVACDIEGNTESIDRFF